MDEHYRTLIVGLGEIGKAVKEAICPEAEVFDINQEVDKTTGPFAVMHICFPYSDNFVEYAQAYIQHWQAKHVAIWSTLPIGTTRLVGEKIVHTPTEGKHPHLADSMRLMPRWVGYNNDAEVTFFENYFDSKGLTVRPVANSDCTEALKLLSTTKYGINLVYTDYMKRVADGVGMNFELTKQWDRDYNRLYQDLGLSQFQKFVLDPPKEVVGGHCVKENSALLYEQYPHVYLEELNAYKKPEGEAA
jgi:hypothetical protein